MDAIQEGNAQYEIFVETTENQFGRYLFNRPNTSMNNYIKLKENQEKYRYDNFLDLGFNSNMPKEIADYIEVIKENQDLLKKLDEGKCTKEEAINKIGGSIDNISRLVGGQDFYLVDGKIEVDVTRNSDIKKQREQKQNQIQESKNVSTKDLTDEER